MSTDAKSSDLSLSALQLTWSGLATQPRAVLEEAVRQVSALHLAPINTALVSPEGFDNLRNRDSEPSLLRSAHQRLQIVLADKGVVELGSVPTLDRAGLAALRPSSHVQVVADQLPGPVQLASTVAQLLVGGVPVVVDHVPLVVRRLLGQRLSSALEQLDPARLNDFRYREAWSVQVRRVALKELTSVGGVATPLAVTVIADLVDSPTVHCLYEQIAAQDWPAVQVILAGTGSVTEPPKVLANCGHRVEVVRAGGRLAARRLALSRADGSLATFMSGDLLYGAHHVTDLVLGHGYARTEVVGARVQRSYVSSLNLCVEVGGEQGEQRGARLSAGSLMSAPPTLRRLEPHLAGTTADPGLTREYAVHDLGVARRASNDITTINRLLKGSEAQTDGWAHAILDPAPSESASVPAWARPHRDPVYDSYFTRSQRRSA